MPYATTGDGTRLYYKDWGSGRPVVLIHGWPLSADSWDSQAMTLAESGFRVISYDRRGFGRSDQPWDGYDYDTLSDDLATIINTTGVENAAIVGFSMGGGEVARYMSRHQGRNVSQVGLIGSILPFRMKTDDNPDGSDPSAFQNTIDQIKADRAKFFATFFKDFYGVGFISAPVSDEVIEQSWLIAMQASLKATISCVQAFSSTDFRDELAAINVPTLIIHGTADKTVPIESSARIAAKGIANSLLLEYEGAPHGLLASNKDQVTYDLLTFLREPVATAKTA